MRKELENNKGAKMKRRKKEREPREKNIIREYLEYDKEGKMRTRKKGSKTRSERRKRETKDKRREERQKRMKSTSTVYFCSLTVRVHCRRRFPNPFS